MPKYRRSSTFDFATGFARISCCERRDFVAPHPCHQCHPWLYACGSAAPGYPWFLDYICKSRRAPRRREPEKLLLHSPAASTISPVPRLSIETDEGGDRWNDFGLA